MLSQIARKQLEGLRKDTRTRIIGAIRQLEENPVRSRPKADIRKLVGIGGELPLYRLRVGNYRVIYEVSEGKVWISEIVKRSRAYNFLL